jgi:hypothetical protein
MGHSATEGHYLGGYRGIAGGIRSRTLGAGQKFSGRAQQVKLYSHT